MTFLCFPQICTLPELLAFILNSLKRKRKRNILAHGYNLLSVAEEDRDADHFKFQGEVTQSAAYLHGSDLWKKVCIRLGTDVTRHLLESCSVFVTVPPTCAFQLCGIPVYDRVSVMTSHFFLQSRFRTRNDAPFGKHRRAATVKRKLGSGNLTISKKRKSSEVRVQQGKRKREHEQKDDTWTHSEKRRRTEPTQGVQVCEKIEEEGQSTSLEKLLDGNSCGSKHTATTTTLPLEGGPSWRSGIYPPLPPSQCFIRTLGFLYGGRGMRGFLLNRKIKGAGASRRLHGQDLIRMVFFEGLAYLNGVERKPKKLPRRFFNMVPLFSRLLRQHRRYPYVKILQRMCPLVEERDRPQGELNSLLPQHCAPHRVYLFVRECLSAVVPLELWGSLANRLHFFVKVRGFLRSGKFERLSLAEVMWKMKVNDCDWLKISKTGELMAERARLFFNPSLR